MIAQPATWDNNAFYNKGDYVTYHDIVYVCLAETSHGDNPGVDDQESVWAQYAGRPVLPHGTGYDVDYDEETVPSSGDDLTDVEINPKTWKQIITPSDGVNKLDASVMDKDQYSGDSNFWTENDIQIDGAGWVYLNNEFTGINVRGPEGGVGEVRFETLTPAQREMIRGEQGVQGIQGEKGDKGDKGDTGAVAWDNLTEEQIAMLRGQQGLSAYEVWLQQPGNAGKSEAEFIAAITGPASITVDKEMDGTSHNPVENRAIYAYITRLQEQVQELQDIVEDLQNRLQYSRAGNIIKFRFGVTNDNQYGYMKDGTTEVTPFSEQQQTILFGDFTTTMGADMDGSVNRGNRSLTASYEPIIATIAGSISRKGDEEEDVDIAYAPYVADLHSSSLEDTPEVGSINQVDMTGLTNYTNILSSATVSPISPFEQEYSQNYLIYKDGWLNPNAPSFTCLRMSIDGSPRGSEKISDLYSRADQYNVQGIYFTTNVSTKYDQTVMNRDGSQSDRIPTYPNYISLTVEPVTAGDSIECEYGLTKSDKASLPSLVTLGRYRGTYQQATFDREVIINFKLEPFSGFYFAAINQSPSFRIKRIELLDSLS